MEKKMGLLDRVQQIKDTEYYIKLLLYGRYGAGKTRFAAAAPNPVWIDTERSAETFRRIPELQNTDLFVPTSFDEIFEFCREVVRKKAYETIVLDTIGRAQDDQIQSDLRKDAQTPGKPGVFKRDPYLPLWGDYRISTNKIDELFMFLQKANIHVIIIAHERIDTDKEGNIIRITPDITPTLKKSIMGLINIAAFLEVETNIKGERVRKLTVNPYQNIEAKNRLDIQETSIKNPNFNEIFLI
jgi:phage nucleotide-binding protein